MKFRKLRIAWSILCSLVCVLLIVLWMRSYSRLEWAAMYATNATHVQAASYHGAIGLQIVNVSGRSGRRKFAPEFGSDSAIIKAGKSRWGPSRNGNVGFGFWQGPATTYLQFPHLFAILISAFSSAVFLFGLPRQFSLRTLLTATTLVAVVLGLVAWSMR